MYHSNGKKFGFYVQRDNWERTIAQIVGIESVSEGESIQGKAPYFGNPKVKARFYEVDEWDYKFTEKKFLNESELHNAGTQTWNKLDL